MASSLWDKSREFFVSERIGVAVWSLRAAEELLGAPRLSPRAVGEFIAASLAEKRKEPAAAAAAPQDPQNRSEALAMMLSPPAGPSAAAEPSTALAPTTLGEGEAAAPSAPGAGRRLALGGKAWRGLMAGTVAALIPLTLLASVGAFLSVSRRGDAEAQPRIEAAAPQTAPTPVMATAATVTTIAAATPPAAQEQVASIDPAQVEKAQIAADPKPNPDAAAAKPATTAKGVARRAAHGKSRRGKDPLAQVGRVVGRFASDVWSGISSIPKRLNEASH